MNAPVSAQASETSRIEAALDALLTAAIRADRDGSLIPERGPTSAGILAGELLEKLQTWTPAQQDADDLLARPVSEATRQGVYTLGVRLHEIGGLRLMREVCHRVAVLDPAHRNRREAIMDHRWNGIGDERGGVWLA